MNEYALTDFSRSSAQALSLSDHPSPKPATIDFDVDDEVFDRLGGGGSHLEEAIRRHRRSHHHPPPPPPPPPSRSSPRLQRRSAFNRQKEKQILDSILGPRIYDRRIRPGGVNGTGKQLGRLFTYGEAVDSTFSPSSSSSCSSCLSVILRYSHGTNLLLLLCGHGGPPTHSAFPTHAWWSPYPR